MSPRALRERCRGALCAGAGRGPIASKVYQFCSNFAKVNQRPNYQANNQSLRHQKQAAKVYSAYCVQANFCSSALAQHCAKTANAKKGFADFRFTASEK